MAMTKDQFFGQPLWMLHPTAAGSGAARPGAARPGVQGLDGLTCVPRQGRTCWACARATGAGTARRAGGPAGAGSGCSSAADTVVVVSDRAKRDGQDARRRAKDQSIHVFTIPAG